MKVSKVLPEVVTFDYSLTRKASKVNSMGMELEMGRLAQRRTEPSIQNLWIISVLAPLILSPTTSRKGDAMRAGNFVFPSVVSQMLGNRAQHIVKS